MSVALPGGATAPLTTADIYTVFGNGNPGYNGDQIPATSASLYTPSGVALDAHGNLVMADTTNERVRVVAESNGTFYGQSMTEGYSYTVAGNGTAGYNGGGISAVSAELHNPGGVALDAHGNLLIADTSNQRIRVVAESTGTFYGQAMTANHIYTVAGQGTAGYNGEGISAVSAELNNPVGVVVDAQGNLMIADTSNQRIQVVAESTGTFYGQAMTANHIYTVAGDGTAGYSSDGIAATSSELNAPNSVALDSHGNLVIADTNNVRIRVVAESTGTFYGRSMTVGDIYTVAGTGAAGFNGNAITATSAELSYPGDVVLDAHGNLVIADTSNQRIRIVAESTGTFYGQAMTANDIYTVAGNGTAGYNGDGIPSVSAELSNPGGVAVDAHGNLVIADTNNQRIRVVAESTGTFYGLSMIGGDIYTVAGIGTAGYSLGDRISATTSAELNNPGGVAVDPHGNLVIADTNNQRIRVVAESTGTFYGQAMTVGDIYTVAGSGAAGYNGDARTAVSAELYYPGWVALDAHGNLVIADTSNQRIRVVAESTGTFYGQAMTVGDIYTVAGNGTAGYNGDARLPTSAELYNPGGVALDAVGNLVIADTSNERIRVVAESTGTFYGQAMTRGDIYTVAGDGTAGYNGDARLPTSADLGNPGGVALDAVGNLLIADTTNQRVRLVAASSGTYYGISMIAGDIYTVAGDGTAGYNGDGISSVSAELYNPGGLVVDAHGNLVIADTSNQSVRVVAASSGTYYGISMISGDIYTVAGDGTPNYNGDGIPSVSAELYNPGGVAVDGLGNLFIADANNNRVREIVASLVVLPPPAVSAAAVSSTDVVVVGRSPGGGLLYQQSSGGGTSWTGWQSVATSDVASQPSAVVIGSNLYVFFRSTLNQLHYFVRTGSTWSTEQNLGGALAGNPVAAVDGNGRIVVVALNGAGNVFSDALPSGGSWTGWTSLAGVLSGDISLSTLGGNVYLFGTNVAGLGWTLEWTAGTTNTWGSWTALGGVFEAGTTLSGAAYNGTLHVQGINNQGILFEATGSGSSWSAWTPLAGILAATPSLATTSSSLFLFDTNPAGVLWDQRNTTSWLGWNSLSGILDTGPVAAAAGTNAYVFGLNNTGNLWYREWTGSSFGAWTNLGGTLATA